MKHTIILSIMVYHNVNIIIIGTVIIITYCTIELVPID